MTKKQNALENCVPRHIRKKKQAQLHTLAAKDIGKYKVRFVITGHEVNKSGQTIVIIGLKGDCLHEKKAIPAHSMIRQLVKKFLFAFYFGKKNIHHNTSRWKCFSWEPIKSKICQKDYSASGNSWETLPISNRYNFPLTSRYSCKLDSGSWFLGSVTVKVPYCPCSRSGNVSL